MSALESRLSNARQTNENKPQNKFVGNSKQFIILVCVIKQPFTIYMERKNKINVFFKGAVNYQDYVQSVLDE